MNLNIGCSADTWGDIRLDSNYLYLKRKSQANIYGDAQKIPFNDMTFDETKAWNVLEHLPHWKEAISDWCRVTKEKIEIEVPIDSAFTRQELAAELFSLSFPLLLQLPKRRRQHLWQFTPSSIITELKNNGFSSFLYFESGPLVFRDNNCLTKINLIRFIRSKQRPINYGYKIVGYRNSR